jgi:DNA invertase Pin-like site-specific DNA recombinase
MDDKRVAVYLRFGSRCAGFILPDEKEEYKKFMNSDVTANRKKSAWVYCRSATGENNALQEQRKASLHYAAVHNYEVIGESSDIGSGLRFDHVGLFEMITAVRNGLVSAVIVRDKSRIGRDLIKALEIENEIKSYGVELLCYTA